MTTTERPGPRSLPACDQVLHPPWCDRARCGTAPGIDASHRTSAWRLIPARHFDNEVSVSSEHDVVPHERRHETCVELQVAHARCGRSPGDDPEAVTSLVRLSYVEALQVAAALIAHAHQLASDVDGRSIGVRSQ